MDNNINNLSKVKDSTSFINSIYDKLNYFDLYGGSVLIFIIITLILCFIVMFCQIMQTKEDIAADWVNQRCKPTNIPFAGFINKPDDKSAFEYTNENFQHCMQNILVNVTSYALQPFQFLISSITNVFNEFAQTLDKSRELVNKLRTGISSIGQDVLQRILNVMIPIQKIFITLMDSFNKIQGVMTAGLYTMLGSYFTLKTLMGAILEMIIKVLVVLSVIIVGLWAVPFTWPAAGISTLVYLGIAIPLAIIVGFMTEVLHIQTSGIPKLRCFDSNTQLVMNDNSVKTIEEICPGDVLKHNIAVTSTFKVNAINLDMYKLNEIVVSGNHTMKYKNKIIPVKDHPESTKIDQYNQKYVYCLNTTTKTIIINNIIFSDWDEILDKSLDSFNMPHGVSSVADIHRYLYGGFEADLLVSTATNSIPICNIEIGDILHNGGQVYGIVYVESRDLMKYDKGLGELPNKLYHLLTTTGTFIVDQRVVNDYNYYIDSLVC